MVTSATGAVAPVGVGLGLPAADLAAVLSFFWEEDLVALRKASVAAEVVL